MSGMATPMIGADNLRSLRFLRNSSPWVAQGLKEQGMISSEDSPRGRDRRLPRVTHSINNLAWQISDTSRMFRKHNSH